MTETKTCSIDGCDRARHCRGWCPMHYQRWRTGGDPGPAAGRDRHPTPEAAFAAKTKWVGDCLVWTGTVSTSEVRPDHPMGVIRVNGRLEKVHRYAYEREHGPLPVGVEVNHKCWNTLCCQSNHLEPATRAENNRYRNGARHDSSTGHRNIFSRNGKWVVRVEHLGVCHGHRHENLDDAIKEAEELRQRLFGAFAGKG